MPFKTFNSWLFDGNLKTEIPNKEVLLKYNSPITQTYVLNMFILNGKLNHYLNEYFNNIGLRYLDKEEFFKFIKKCVIDFKIKRNTIPFIRMYKKNSKLYERLRVKLPVLKSFEISMLCDSIDKMDDKDIIYSSLGLDKPSKPQKQKNIEKNKITNLDDLLSEFKIMRTG